MPRKVRSIKLDTRTARANLPRRREPHWSRIASRAYLGYRKAKTSGTWIARWQEPKTNHRHYQALGQADDDIAADGSTVLTFDQAQEAARAWFTARAKRIAGNDDLTVSDALAEYVTYLKRERSASTVYDVEKRAAKHIDPKLGNHRIEDLTPRKIREWRDSLVSEGSDGEVKRKSMDSANHVLSQLKAALNRMYRDNRIGSDAAWRKVAPYRGVSEARKIFLTEKEGQRLINACHDPDLRDLVAAALTTGARLGELTAAQVGDIDLDEGLWSVQASKTGKRDMWLPPAALEIFRRRCAGRSKRTHVFIRGKEPWTKSLHRRPFAATVKRAGLDPDTTFYALRHSYVSHALKAGIIVQVLAENLGTSALMIEKHYGKFLRSDRKQMIDAASPTVTLEPSKLVTL